MRAQSAYQRVVDSTRTEYEGGPRMPERGAYEQDNCRYGDVMRMIREGRDDNYIVRLRPEFKKRTDVLAVYRKIADGTICRGKALRGRSTRTRTAVGLFAEVIAGSGEEWAHKKRPDRGGNRESGQTADIHPPIL